MSKEQCKAYIKEAIERANDMLEVLDDDSETGGLPAFVELYEDVSHQLLLGLGVALREATQHIGRVENLGQQRLVECD